MFQRDLQDGYDPAQVKDDRLIPGLLTFRGWGLERQLGAERRRYIADLRADIEEMKNALPPRYAFVHGVRDGEKAGNLKISLRGSPFKLGDEVPRRFLSVLSEAAPTPFTKGSGRLELAEAIVRQPIAMRVIVNRIWKGHFGTGVVDTPSNFGEVGERPINPELLEHLAWRFVETGMSIKTLHREIMLSAVYQSSSDVSPGNVEKDPANRLYWHMSRHRLSAEQIRDSLLFVSGALDRKLGGPSQELTPFYNRRTVYGAVSRYKLDQYLQLFDFPSPNLSSEKRFTTTVPLQRLFFMNSDFMQQQGELLAHRAATEPDDRSRIQKVYRLIFGRAATDAEVQAGLDYLASEPMKEYEERKAAKAKEKSAPDAKKNAARSRKPGPDRPVKGEGMMAGVVAGAEPKDEAKKLLPITPWGRYVKILLSSSEFLFVD